MEAFEFVIIITAVRCWSLWRPPPPGCPASPFPAASSPARPSCRPRLMTSCQPASQPARQAHHISARHHGRPARRRRPSHSQPASGPQGRRAAGQSRVGTQARPVPWPVPWPVLTGRGGDDRVDGTDRLAGLGTVHIIVPHLVLANLSIYEYRRHHMPHAASREARIDRCQRPPPTPTPAYDVTPSGPSSIICAHIVPEPFRGVLANPLPVAAEWPACTQAEAITKPASVASGQWWSRRLRAEVGW
jgi:hypothetical protein